MKRQCRLPSHRACPAGLVIEPPKDIDGKDRPPEDRSLAGSMLERDGDNADGSPPQNDRPDGRRATHLRRSKFSDVGRKERRGSCEGDSIIRYMLLACRRGTLLQATHPDSRTHCYRLAGRPARGSLG